MRIVSVAVSNIRSFKYDPRLTTKVKFGLKDLNLIIGPNGAGKSNLMEVIARLFSNIYNADYANNNGDLNQLIQTQVQPTQLNTANFMPNSLTKNRNFKNKPSKIQIKIQLDKTDIENLKRIKTKADVLKKIDNKFYIESVTGYKDIFNYLDQIPARPKIYTITLSDQETYNSVSHILEEVGDKTLASVYLKSYQMLRNAINIYNDYLKPEQFKVITQNSPPNISYEQALDSVGIKYGVDKPIENLLPLLQILSVQERLAEISLDYTPLEGSNGSNLSRDNRSRQYDRQSNNRSLLGGINNAQSISFELIKELILREAFDYIVDSLNVVEVITKINSNNKLLAELNDLLSWFSLNIKLIEFEPSRSYVRFELTEGQHSANIIDLSSGQRAIMNIASALALTKITDAVVIIDEIENHLHPSIQTKLREMLQAASGNSSEVIAITHSAIFVNSKTLKNTARVYHNNGYSTVKMCGGALIGPRAKTLGAVLNYTNGSRIFFTNRVLFVEGPSDELFFTAYVFKFHASEDIEVLSVGGDEGNMANWRPIVEALGVKVYQINDLDQAIKGTAPQPAPICSGHQGISHSRVCFSLSDLTRVDTVITGRKAQSQYILTQGSLEEYYTSTIAKTKNLKMDRVIDFLSSGDWTRVQNGPELSSIIADVLS
jgi:putative ATP-dependent endonuclease of the OLD family